MGDEYDDGALAGPGKDDMDLSFIAEKLAKKPKSSQKAKDKKRKAAKDDSKEDSDEEGGWKRKNRVRAKPFLQESEYADSMGSALSTTDHTKLSASSLLRRVGELDKSGSLSKSLKKVVQAEAAAKPQVDSVIEQKVIRRETYKETSKDMGESWTSTIRANRKAETLDLRSEVNRRPNRLTANAMVSKFKPTTNFEQEISKLLEGHTDEKEIEAREQKEMEEMNLNPEEIKKRQYELQKMRSLLFYEQQKRHRINKIKSKAYHRIRNRQKRRKEAMLEDDEENREEQEKIAMKRMEERMSLKHKTASKWLQGHMKRSGQHMNAGVRKAMQEQHRLGEELKQKIDMAEDGDPSPSSSDEEEEDDEESIKQRAVDKTKQLITEIDEDASSGKHGGGGEKKKGLFAMKFMQRAAQKQREEAKKQAEMLLDELRDDEAGSDEEAYADSDGETAPAEQDEEVAGLEFSGGSLEVKPTSKRVRVDGHISVIPAKAAKESSQPDDDDDDDDGRAPAEVMAHLDRLLAEESTSDSSDDDDDDDSESDDEKEQAIEINKNDANDSSKTTPAQVKAQAAKKTKKADANDSSKTAPAQVKAQAAKKTKKADANDSSKTTPAQVKAQAAKEAVSRGGELNPWLNHGGGKSSRKKQTVEKQVVLDVEKATQEAARASQAVPSTKLSQGDLIKRAFATGDAEAEFAELRRQAEEEGSGSSKRRPTEVAQSNGWGAWAGLGAPLKTEGKPNRKRRRPGAVEANDDDSKKKKQEEEDDQGVSAETTRKGKERLMPLVVVSKKRSKKAATLKVGAIPYPFTSRQQYERSLQVPVGKEWNTLSAAREFNKPSIVTGAGQVITPAKNQGKKRQKK